MKTIIKKTIETKTSEVEFGFWDKEADDFIPIEPSNPEHQKLLGTNELLLDAIRMCIEDLKGMIDEDLKDIWKKLD